MLNGVCNRPINRKAVILLGLLTFTIFLALSILFYRERTVFLDIAYHLFYILKNQDFAIQSFRFGAALTQAVPLIASYAHIPLSYVAMLYSAAFALLPLVTFLNLVFVFKNSRVACAFLLYETLMIAHTFFWVQSELPQAVCFLFILIALLDNASRHATSATPAAYLFAAALLFTVAFTHPLMLFPTSFTLVFLFIKTPSLRRSTKSLGIYFTFVYFVKQLLFRTAYDSHAIPNPTKLFSGLLNFFQVPSVSRFYSLVVGPYLPLMFLFLALLTFYTKNKNYRELVLTVCFTLGYLTLVQMSYPVGASDFYLENQYRVAAIFVVLPFVCDVMPALNSKYVQPAIITGCCLFAVLRIFWAAPIYTNRLSWNERVLAITADQSDKKIIIPAKQVPLDTLLMTWGSSYEFWLLSTMADNNSRSIIIEETPGEFDYALLAKRAFITKWGVFAYADLKGPYFKFTDTSRYVRRSK